MDRNTIFLISYDTDLNMASTWSSATSSGEGFSNPFASVTHPYFNSSQPTAALIDLRDMTVLGYRGMDETEFGPMDVLGIIDENL